MSTTMPEKIKSHRAGVYVRQLTGYRAFIPATLPTVSDIQFDAELHRLLSESNLALGRLDGSIQTLPNPDLFMFMYIRKEAVLSNQIEGTEASINDVIKAEANMLSVEKRGEVNEVINYISAMNYGLERLKDLPLCLRLIKEIHERLMKNVRGDKMSPGEFRTSQNWIGPRNCMLSDAIFVPPPHDEALRALGELEKFLLGDDNMPPLIRIGLAHAQFETIHPFLDGNGRIGRLLITFFLCQNGILQKPVLYLSYFLKKYQLEYYRNLQNIREYGEWEAWLKFFLHGISTVAQQATETARKIVALRESHRYLIMEKFGSSSGNAIRVLERLYGRPVTNVTEVTKYLDISFPNANNLVQKFVENELLYQVTEGSRNRRFMYVPYTELFSNIE